MSDLNSPKWHSGGFMPPLKIEPHIDIFKRNRAYDMAVKKLIAAHTIEFSMILEGCKASTSDF